MTLLLIFSVIILALYINLVRTESEVIAGCEARGDADKPYLTRYKLFSTHRIRCFFHKFHRSDADDLHDHPWNFLSIILWRGYIEETWMYYNIPCLKKQRRIRPFTIIYRKAEHAHRVILIDGKPAYTLVFTFKYKRHWGFFNQDSFWTYWKVYFKEKGC